MSSATVTIVRTGTANLASVVGAVRRLGVEPIVTSSAAEVAAGNHLILPGVGTLGAAMQELDARGLTGALRRRIIDGRPVLAVCLGLQMLLDGSEESPGVAGLGVAPGVAARFGADVRVPHLGWSMVKEGPTPPGCAYFAHSYRLASAPPGWSCSWADHGGPFIAAMSRGTILACQFHPELSGPWGAALIKRWFEGA